MSWNTNATEFVPGKFSFGPKPAQSPVVAAPVPQPSEKESWEDEDAQSVIKPFDQMGITQQTQNKPQQQQAPKLAQQQAPKGAQQPATKGVQQQAPKGAQQQNPKGAQQQQTPKVVQQQAPKGAQQPKQPQNPKQTQPAQSAPKPAQTAQPAQPSQPALSTPKPAQPAKIVLKEDDVDEDDDDGETETLKIADDAREHINIVFIGHVDAGKSTISGNILNITGNVDARIIEKYEREAKEKNRTSWYLAYIMDTNEEERAKGKTVEVGRAHFSTEKKRYTILDAPGHRNYVPNMIAGVAQADIAILVISARKGEFEAGFDRSGQTREHALLAKTLGVKKLIIAVNKMDEPTVNWSEERFNFIKQNFSDWLIKDRVFQLKEVEWIPISGYDGSNLLKKVEPKICPWYHGLPLLPLLDAQQPLARLDSAPLRIPVLDKYKDAGKLVILGKIESGVLKTGDTLAIYPGGTSFTVFQIENDEGLLTKANPGENIRAIVKGGLEEEAVWRGALLCHPVKPPAVTAEFVGQIQILELLEHKSLFSAGYECVIHIHTAVEEVSVSLLLEKLNPKTGKTETKLPKFVQSKDIVIAHMTTTKPLALEKFDDFAQMGRFTLRDEGKTVALGKILAINAPIRRKKGQEQ